MSNSVNNNQQKNQEDANSKSKGSAPTPYSFFFTGTNFLTGFPARDWICF
jgi:hypothetical protein